jgi:hypothetical protein
MTPLPDIPLKRSRQENEGIDSVIRALHEMEAFVNSESHQVHDVDNGQWDPEMLLQLEEKAAELRSRVQVFYQLQRQHLTSGQKFESNKIHIHPHVVLASRSQNAASKKKLFWVQKAVDSILSSLEQAVYLDASRADALPKVVNQCETVANWLQLTYHPAETTNLTTSDFNLSETNKTHHSPATIAENEPEEDKQHTSTSTIISTSTSTKNFPFELFSSTWGIHRLLLRGPEGAGKTHACDAIESLLSQEGTKGTQVHIRSHHHGTTIPTLLSPPSVAQFIAPLPMVVPLGKWRTMSFPCSLKSITPRGRSSCWWMIWMT